MTLPRQGRIYLAEKLLKTVILFAFIPKVMSGRNLPMPGSPLWDGAPLHLALIGPHQLHNTCTVLETVEALRIMGISRAELIQRIQGGKNHA